MEDSENEIEVLFENVTPSSPHRNVDFEECLSPQTNRSKTVLAEQALIIKSETKAYIQERLKSLHRMRTKESNIYKNNQKQLKLTDLNFKLKDTEVDKTVSKMSPLNKNVSNEDDVNMMKETFQSCQRPESLVNATSPDSSGIIKFSNRLKRTPNKFSINGSPASSKKNGMLFSNLKRPCQETPKLPSPLTFMRQKMTPKESFSSAEGANSIKKVKRKLNFSSASKDADVSQSQITSEYSQITISSIINNFDEGYILYQFKLHIDVVLTDELFRDLFSDQEMEVLKNFRELNNACKDFYARMHNRKYKWNRLSDIKYDVAELENVNYLEENGFFCTDLCSLGISELLELLKISELKNLCKSLSLKFNNKNRKKLFEEILRYSQNQRTLGMKFLMTSSKDVVKEKIIEMLDTCFILAPLPRKLFRRIHLLFNLKFNRNETHITNNQELFQIQYAGTNTAMYPEYQIDPTAKIFQSREELLRYELSDEILKGFFELIDAKDFGAAAEILNVIRMNFISEVNDFSVTALSKALSLRKFCPGTNYAYGLFKGIDVLKKLKNYVQAIEDLELLLSQTVYLPYKRSRWYEKLISIQRTTRAFNEIADTIQRGVYDSYRDDQAWYLMTSRAKELLKKKNGVRPEVKSVLRDIPFFPPIEVLPSTQIRAQALEGKAGYKRVYVQNDGMGDGKIFSSVEELVINHYCPQQFKLGKHAENSLVSSLFGILLWNIIYDFVPCAFISPYQARPFDLSTGEFYLNRQTTIDEKLTEMERWSFEEILSHVKAVYEKQNGKTSLVNWNYFRSATDIIDIITSIGWNIVLKICERYAKKYREARSGFPDLCLWTPGQKDQYKFVEVKGPNDQLGLNQKIWLDFLVKINANVEVCYVTAQGAKLQVLTGEREELSEFDPDNEQL